MNCFPSPRHALNYGCLLDHSSEPSNSDEVLRDMNDGQFNLLERQAGSVSEIITGTCQGDYFNEIQAYTLPDVRQRPSAWSAHNQISGAGMWPNTQLWPAPMSCEVDPALNHQSAWPYNSHEVGDSTSMSRWTTNEHIFNPLLSTQFSPTPAIFQNDLVQNTTFEGYNTHPTTSKLPHYGHSSNLVYPKQEQEETASAVVETTEVEDAIARIGSVLSNGRFICDLEECAGRSFARQAELRRHHTTLHAPNKPNFWCLKSSCQRSRRRGGEAFHRKDKLKAHVLSMHPGTEHWYTW